MSFVSLISVAAKFRALGSLVTAAVTTSLSCLMTSLKYSSSDPSMLTTSSANALFVVTASLTSRKYRCTDNGDSTNWLLACIALTSPRTSSAGGYAATDKITPSSEVYKVSHAAKVASDGFHDALLSTGPVTERSELSELSERSSISRDTRLTSSLADCAILLLHFIQASASFASVAACACLACACVSCGSLHELGQHLRAKAGEGVSSLPLCCKNTCSSSGLVSGRKAQISC